jgi:hypothetical protein
LWHGEVTVRDNVTGLRRIVEPEDANDVTIDFLRPLVIGSIKEVTVGVEATCCDRGVLVRGSIMMDPKNSRE